MLAKNWLPAKADSAGIVVGARVPIVLTSRADSLRAAWRPARLPSSTPTHGAKAPRRPQRDRDGTILVVNAGSSSVKFEIFAIAGGRTWPAHKGADGRHRRPAAAGRQFATARKLIDKAYLDEIADVPAAMAGDGRLAARDRGQSTLRCRPSSGTRRDRITSGRF